MVLGNHLLQSLAKVTYQTASDAAGIHFSNIDTGFLQETAINADLTEFVFDQYQFLTLITLGDHFLDQSGLAGAKETGVNIDFSHNIFTPSK